MADPAPTPNLKLQPIAANRMTWADLMNNNLRIIDAAVGTYFIIQDLQGVWANSTAYTAGESVVDTDSSVVYQCLVDHTSSIPPATFEDDRDDFPTYWGIYSTPARSRGIWTSSTNYALNDFVTSGSQYAICIETHTSSDSFTVDTNNGKWSILVDLSTAGDAVLPTPGGAGDANKFAITNSLGTGYTIVDANGTHTLLGATSIGKSIYQALDAAAVLALLGAAPSGAYQPLSASLTSLSTMTIGAFANNLLSTTSASNARSTLGLGSLATTNPGTGVATFLATPSSANLAAAITDETGTGTLVFSASPALTGTPTAPTAAASNNSTQIATTAYADRIASQILQIVYDNDPDYGGTGGTAIPYDDTIPQITEGNSIMTLSITPQSASSVLIIEASAIVTRAAGSDVVVMSVCETGVADAKAATPQYVVNSQPSTIMIRCVIPSGSTTTREYQIRIGSNTGSPLQFNGASSARILGGVASSGIVITERM